MEVQMKTTIVAIFLMASLLAASADWVERTDLQRQQYEERQVEAEKKMAAAHASRHFFGKNTGAELRLERACTHALESGVDNDVRRSYGCKDL
jgi:hypothetical protein